MRRERVEITEAGGSWRADVELPAGSVLVVVAEPHADSRATVIVGGSEDDDRAAREFQNALLEVEPGELPDGPLGPYSILLDPLLTALGGNYLSPTNAFVADSLEDYGLLPVPDAAEFVLVEGYQVDDRHEHDRVVSAFMVTPSAMQVRLIVGAEDPGVWDVAIHVVPIDADTDDPEAFLAAAADNDDLAQLLGEYY